MTVRLSVLTLGPRLINPLAPELFFFKFQRTLYMNVKNTGTKEVSIMKQTAF